MNRIGLSVVTVFVFAIVLAACGGNNKVAEGAKNMKNVLSDVKSAVDAGDAVKAKSEGAKLEESWAKFEDNVKGKSKEVYDKVETPLHVIEAGVGVDPLDKETLDKAITDLEQVLGEAEKL
jgi:iron uptake system EfeUOB component EfeO/EfeM